MICIGIPLMRRNKFSLSLWLIRYLQKDRSVEIYPYQSVENWAGKSADIQKIYDKLTLILDPVRHVGIKFQKNDMHDYSYIVTLPTISINLIESVDVIGSSEMLFTKDGNVLYDEYAKGNVNRYGC